MCFILPADTGRHLGNSLIEKGTYPLKSQRITFEVMHFVAFLPFS